MGAFSVFSDRKRKKQKPIENTPTVAQYYEIRARRVSMARWLCMLCTVLLVVYGFAVHGDELTVDNFRYMLKFVEFAEKESEGVSLVTFDYGEENRGALYKGDVVVLNKSGLSIYSEEADRVLNVAFRMEDPRLAVSGTGILAYDLGGYEVRMFNSYSQLALLSMSYPVYGLCVSDAGNFAVITSEKNYRTSVIVYDQYAKERYHRALSTAFVDQVSLSSDGEKLLTLGHSSKGGSLVTTVQCCSLKQEDPLQTFTYTGELPLKVSWMTDHTYAVLTGEALRVFDTEKEDPVATYSLADVSLQNCEIIGDRILLVLSAEGLSGGTVLHALDGGLNTLFTASFEGSIEDLESIGNETYVLMMGVVTKLSADGKTRTLTEVSKDVLSILKTAEGEPLLFEKSRVLRLADATADQNRAEEFLPLDESDETTSVLSVPPEE